MEEEKKEDTKSTEEVEKKDTKPVEKKEEKKVSDPKVETEVKKEEAKKEEVKKETKKQEKPKKEEKKKAEKTKGEKKKSKTGIIIGVVVVVLLIIAILAYMFLMTDSPKKSVETMLSDLKSGNYSQAILASVLEEEDFNQEMQRLLFDKLEWKVLNVKEEGDKATVEIEITNKDFKTIIGNYMQRIIKVAFSGQYPSEEEMTNYLIEELNNNEIQNVTSNQSIVLEKKDGKWEVTGENDFVNILLPGFNEAINSFSN